LSEDPAAIEANPLPYYLAMCESVDHEMQRLLDAMDPETRANTIVIFIGDNGTERSVLQSPIPQNHGKATLYEGGVRVPMVISGPGIPRAGEREPALVNTSDLFATIAELCGAVLPVYEDSRSLLPLFDQAGGSVRACSYAEVNDLTVGTARRSIRYKRIDLESGEQQFYDLQEDPFELNDLLEGTLTEEEETAFNALGTACERAVNVEEMDREDVIIYPVPVRDRLNIAGTTGAPVQYSVHAMDGKAVEQGSTSNSYVELNDLPAGTYVLGWNGQHVRFTKQ
jgi:arylsulfatase A-like enzyme